MKFSKRDSLLKLLAEVNFIMQNSHLNSEHLRLLFISVQTVSLRK